MRVLMVSHSGATGGSNSVVLSMLRRAPDDVEAFWVFMEEGPLVAASPVPWAMVESGRARELWRAPGAVRGLRAAIRAARADVVFAHITKAHLYAGVAARLEGVPYLWWQQERYGQKPFMHQVAGRLPADAVICAAEHTRREQERRFRAAPVVLVHLGAPASAAPSARAHHESERPVLGIVGRLQRWKRVELALRAMPAVLAQLPGARLRVLGDASPGVDEDYPAQLRAQARALGIADAVEFRGHVADGSAAIRELDVLVHCAEIEPFGLVPVEAMLHGVPPVVPGEGGPSETVRDGIDGIHVDPTETEALARAVVTLARDPALRARYGAAGRARALALFTEERMTRDAWAVTRAVAQRRDPRAALSE